MREVPRFRRLLLRAQAEGTARADMDVGARLARRPTRIRATGRSSLSRYRERHPGDDIRKAT